MDTNSTQFKARLGLFVVIGFVIFALAIFLIGRQKHLFDPVFNMTTTFHNISGLQVGNNVRFSGITVGTVDRIQIINDSTVKVDMIVKKRIQPFIKIDSRATIGSDGIIGDKIIIITQGSSTASVVNDGQIIPSEEPLEMESIILNLNQTAQNVDVISMQLIQVLSGINTGKGTIGRLINDTTIAENISQTIVNFKNTSKGLDENIDTMMVKVNLASENILTSSDVLTQIMNNINEQNGAIGKFINDTALAKEIEETILNLKRSGEGISNTMDAVNNSFLFRGYFKKKAKRDAQEKLDSMNNVMLPQKK